MRRIPTPVVVVAATTALLAFSGTPSARADAAPAASPEASVQIIGGTPSVEVYPWLARGKYSCGASVIADTWLVTAAHCLKAHSPFGTMFEARIGSNDRDAGGQVIPGKKEFLHPDYPNTAEGKRKMYDIGLVKLSAPSTGGTVTLPTSRTAVDTPTRILGWGAQDNELTKFPRYLHELDTKVREDSACDTASGIFMPGFEICTHNPEGTKGACSGDSGGPQITKVDGKWVLIGVTSRGGAACGTSPSVYTDVFAYKSWILNTVRAEDGKLPPELAAWEKGTPTQSPAPTATPTVKPTSTPTSTATPTSAPTTKPTNNPKPRPTWWPTNWPWPIG